MTGTAASVSVCPLTSISMALPPFHSAWRSMKVVLARGATRRTRDLPWA